jgi:hypothetical protein
MPNIQLKQLKNDRALVRQWSMGKRVALGIPPEEETA